jgi:hypothetical protein
MIPHDTALIAVRVNPKRGRPRWARPAVLDRIRAKQAENVTKMHEVHRATQLQEATEVCVALLGAEVVDE